MDEVTQKDWEGLQRKVMENQGQLKAVIAGARTKEGEKKRNELTEQELAELPDETVVYKSIGRAFLYAPKPELQDFMKNSASALGEELEKMKTTKAYLERQQTELENNVKEFIQNSPFLKARFAGVAR
mmetsp:Transcript_18767/g.31528  ORF Transcript_18767/g.31528 Transcript_18767/m.31528 type:complete len:128 (-) Transcript_18767:274-657(-)|eukprot:CAMPEP_0198200196 /NCGR_PEP_ID=MMETSP1445-20131203/3241_1 /TAXON_ID=36898 /ORGANISM="Pyramimonas sp., Strain CCMP2087" /LENGTH=127 /DNA_ID=CAMNT_0043870173 /DNA_START=113 /DNA_END=496 /DNA_ORIENTATION=-